MTEQIWRELNDRLRRFVRSRIASESDVDDILQTVFLSIHSRFAELRQVDRLESWVFQIARNAMIDHFRRQRDTLNDVKSVIAEPEESVVDNLNGELSSCLGAMIQRLPEDQRRALSLYELEGISQQEIAERETLSVSGAKSRIQRGRKSLEEMLKACCEFQLDRRGNVLEYEPSDPDCCDEHCR